MDRLLERGLQARHLRPRQGWLEAHHHRVLAVLDVGHHPLEPPLRGGIVVVFFIRLVTRPIAALEVEVETGWLGAALVGPAQIDAVEVGRVAVTEPHG